MLNPYAKSGRGFTLVEVVVAIAIAGIVAGMAMLFIDRPVQGYADSAARAELADTADIALRRMTRDLRLALPNSVRITADAGGNPYIEFLPTKTGGRYLAAGSAPAGDNPNVDADGKVLGNVLSFTDNTLKTFDMVGPGLPTDAQAIGAGNFIVVDNLGPASAADAYSCASSTAACNLTTVASINAGANTITLTGNPFAGQTTASPSPGRRFQVVTKPVTYVCDLANNELKRYWGYSISADQPADMSAAPLAGASSALLAQGVIACAFSRNVVAGGELVGLSLSLRSEHGNAETVTLYHQVHIENVP